MKFIFLGLVSVFLWQACSDSAAARRRTAECYVRYDALDGQWLSEVTLREGVDGQSGGKAVESPTGVRYQNVLMRTLPFKDITYRLEQAGGYTATHKFEWQDSDEKKYRFEMDMPAMTGFTFGTKNLSNKQPASLRWDGAPLERNESVVFMWESTDGGLTVPMEITGSQGMDHIDFPAAQMAKIPAGNWSLYLVRKKQVKRDLDGTQTVGVVEYYSRPDTFSVQN
ncbi:MAG: hypothetical protein H6574_12920 [Lewinellaceae bacterium]|nr:hypothetical protein [Saprospiraceae bacterium]MCB9315520.1 hypothetical protein [Lewinellaceae bacterium]MCB9331976.1 hypothetical protein [Lewinellaceae bacterium]